jgi:hypothetical protein
MRPAGMDLRSRLIAATAFSVSAALGCVGDFDRAWEEGGRHGLANDLSSCWEVSFSRLEACESLGCTADAMTFARSCGRHAGADATFCSAVPSGAWDFVGWVRDTCARAGNPSEACEKTLRNVASACSVGSDG